MTYYVRALHLLIQQGRETGTIPHLTISVLHKLCEIETRIGRLSMFMVWDELQWVVAHNGAEDETPSFIKAKVQQDMIWACRIANTNMNNKQLSYLPDILQRQGLLNSYSVLMLALGYGQLVDPEIVKLYGDDWRAKLSSQPVMDQLLYGISLADGENGMAETVVNNCQIKVLYKNTPREQVIAETLLALLETICATFDMREVVVTTQHLTIQIIESEETRWETKDDSQTYILHISSRVTDEEWWMIIAELIAVFFIKFTMSQKEILSLLKEKQKNEHLMDRAISMMRYHQAHRYVLGDKFKNTITDWRKESDKTYVFEGEDTREEKISYSKIQQNTIIQAVSPNMQWWEDAKWKGCGILKIQERPMPPIFALLFTNIDAGIKIIKAWKSKAEKNDLNLKMMIILGIDADHPTYYRVCIGPSVHSMGSNVTNERYAVAIHRKHTMTPKTDENISTFRRLFTQYGCCWLTALGMKETMSTVSLEEMKCMLKFSNVEFIEAWKISPRDDAFYALEPDDNPYIPDSHKSDAPVLNAMETLRRICKEIPQR